MTLSDVILTSTRNGQKAPKTFKSGTSGCWYPWPSKYTNELFLSRIKSSVGIRCRTSVFVKLAAGLETGRPDPAVQRSITPTVPIVSTSAEMGTQTDVITVNRKLPVVGFFGKYRMYVRRK